MTSTQITIDSSGHHVRDPEAPRTISILGQPYQIRRSDLTEDHGFLDTDARVIHISRETSEPDRTLLHEVLHAILVESGQRWSIGEDHEEGVVRALESGLWQAGYRLRE